MTKKIAIAAGLAVLLAGCERAPTPNSYVAMALNASEHCSVEDSGKAWFRSLPTKAEKLQGALACAAYWTGRRDQAQSDLEDILSERKAS